MTSTHERPTDWNATVYHRVSAPQLEWGSALLESLEIRAPDVVLDVGCGTGRVTLELIERMHATRVVAVDLSPTMIAAAKSFLSARAGRVHYVQADAIALPFESAADVIFSTATFHWINDHERLFRSLYAALKKPGRLIAQCGGGPNLATFRETCASVMRLPALAPLFLEWRDPWEFADAHTASRRLREAGFVNVRTQVFPTPLVHTDAERFREFIEHVICGPYLRRIPTLELRERFLDELVLRAAQGNPPFRLDYWRLNLSAEKV